MHLASMKNQKPNKSRKFQKSLIMNNQKLVLSYDFGVWHLVSFGFLTFVEIAGRPFFPGRKAKLSVPAYPTLVEKTWKVKKTSDKKTGAKLWSESDAF